MQINRKDLSSGVVLLELQGPLQSGVECLRLEHAMDELLRENQTRVVLDFANVAKVDSAGVGRIVKCLSRLKIAGGTMRLSGVTGMVCGILKLTKVDRLVKIYPTAKEAADSFFDAPASAAN